MTDWLSQLEQLDIPDGAVAGLSTAEKPIIEGKLLQLSAGDRPLFFRGQQIDILKRLRTLLPDMPAGRLNTLRPFFHAAWLEDSVVFLSSEAFEVSDLMGNFSLLLTFRQ